MGITRRTAIGVAAAAAAAVPVLAVAPSEAAASHHDAELVSIAGGSTAVALNPDTAEILTGLGLEITPTGHAFVDDEGALNFPIRRSELNPTTLETQIAHAGGLRFAVPGGPQIKLSRYDINIDDPDLSDDVETSDLTAKVNRNRFDRPEVFDLDLSGASVDIEGNDLTVGGVEVNLSEQGAAALNATFGTALPAGVNIGEATVSTHIRGERKLPSNLLLRARGGTTVALDPDTVAALEGLGVSIGTDRAAVPGALGDVTFPIVGGRVKSDSLAGKIRHIGELELIAGEGEDEVLVELGRFTIDSENGVLTGVVRANGERVGRAPLFKLGLADLEKIANGKDLRLSKVALSLTGEAAELLNGAFGTDALAEDTPIGTAVADARVASAISRSVSFRR